MAYLVDSGREEEAAEQQKRTAQHQGASVSRVAGTLSGGNQQKVVLAKWLAMKPQVMHLR